MVIDRQQLIVLNKFLLTLTLFINSSIKANEYIYENSNIQDNDSFIYNDSLIHFISFNTDNRYSLKYEFNNDYLFREFKADKDSILKLDRIIFKAMETSKFPLKFNLSDSFKHFHKQYIIGQINDKEYLIVNCIILDKEFQFSKFIDFNFFYRITTMSSFEKHFIIYIPLFKDGEVDLTIVY